VPTTVLGGTKNDGIVISLCAGRTYATDMQPRRTSFGREGLIPTLRPRIQESEYQVRRFVVLAMLSLLGACSETPTVAGAAPLTDTYVLESVDGGTLPVSPVPGGSWHVVSGSLTLQPDGYFVLAESDSSWNGRAVIRDNRTDGGTWTMDGSMLILSDTALEANDAYGAAAASTYFGRVASHTVLLTIATDDATRTHLYQYER
jgi:hypothetical protein